jgi:hypothetical protein
VRNRRPNDAAIDATRAQDELDVHTAEQHGEAAHALSS